MIPKFRAWDKEIKMMIEISLIDFEKHVIRGIHWKFGETESIKFNDIALMQLTGLRDVNNLEIFEGDVILWTYWDEFEDSGRAKIIFDKGMFKLLDIHTEKEVWDSLSDCIENCDVYIEGNIYENPEFLEEKK